MSRNSARQRRRRRARKERRASPSIIADRRDRRLLGLGVGRNLHVEVSLDVENPVPLAAVEHGRVAESAAEVHEAMVTAQQNRPSARA